MKTRFGNGNDSQRIVGIMDVSRFDGLNSLPAGFLESIAGGVLRDDHRNAIREFALYFKKDNVPLECTLAYWQMHSDGYVDPADEEECENIIRSVYDS